MSYYFCKFNCWPKTGLYCIVLRLNEFISLFLMVLNSFRLCDILPATWNLILYKNKERKFGLSFFISNVVKIEQMFLGQFIKFNYKWVCEKIKCSVIQ